jgi:hypothetical protein
MNQAALDVEHISVLNVIVTVELWKNQLAVTF